jgi:hypothetical protein
MIMLAMRVSRWLPDAFHERPVDLDDVDRQVRQVAQRGVARPEVVDGDRDAQALQQLQLTEHRLGVAHQGGLGDFDHDAFGGKSGALQRLRDELREVRLLKLAHRDVDRDVDFVVATQRRVKSRHLVERGVEHPCAKRLDLAGLLGELDEARR